VMPCNDPLLVTRCNLKSNGCPEQWVTPAMGSPERGGWMAIHFSRRMASSMRFTPSTIFAMLVA
jgi:hypothetical protein